MERVLNPVTGKLILPQLRFLARYEKHSPANPERPVTMVASKNPQASTIIHLTRQVHPDILPKAIAEYRQYERNARRCGFWPYKPQQILLLEQLIAAATLPFNQESEAA